MSSQLITLDNLNTVYGDIRDRIDALGDVYSPKGSRSCKELNALLGDETLVQGHVYNVIVNEDNPAESLPGIIETLKDGDNVVCIVTAEGKKWAKLGGIYELANNNVAGLVFLGEGTDFTNDDANTAGYAELGLNMGSVGEVESDIGIAHKTYVKVPFASEATYGLVSTEKQSFSGEKLFLNNIDVINNSSITVKDGGINTSISARSISVGNGGETCTGVLNVSGNVSAVESSLGKITAGETNVGTLTLRDATGKPSNTLDIEGGATATEASLGILKVSDQSTVGSLDVSGALKAETLTVSSVSQAENKEVSLVVDNDSKAESIDITGTITASQLIVDSMSLAEGKNLTVASDVYAKILTGPLDAQGTSDLLITADTANITSLKATNADVTTIKGNTAGCTLNVNTINVKNSTDTSEDVELKFTDNVPGSRDTAFTNNNKKGLTCNMNFGVAGHLYAYKVHNAVWNDLADAIEIDVKPEYGYVYCFDGEHYNKSSKYCQKGIIGIHSDTAGMIMGEKGSENELNCAVAGFVLAHTDKIYASGTPLTTGKNGVLTKMKKKDLILHPDRLVANFWKEETAEKWNGVEVNNRHWVKVR